MWGPGRLAGPVHLVSRDRFLPAHARRILAVVLALWLTPGLGHAQSRTVRAGQDSTSSVTGTVEVHETGAPLPEASVSLAAGSEDTRGLGTRITDAEGRFTFRRVPPGAYHLVVTFIGYHDLSDTLTVPAESDLRLELALSVSPVALQPLVVVARRGNATMRGFEQRRARGFGTFITRDQIDQRQPTYVSQILRTVPGVTLAPVSRWGYGVFLRDGCRPVVWIDGTRIVGDNAVDQMLQPNDVQAIEVYRGAELPVQFGPSPCGAVVFWTRVPEPGTGHGSIWKRALLALAFVTVAYLLTK